MRGEQLTFDFYSHLSYDFKNSDNFDLDDDLIEDSLEDRVFASRFDTSEEF